MQDQQQPLARPELARRVANELRAAADLIERYPELAPEKETIGPYLPGWSGCEDCERGQFIAFAQAAAEIATLKGYDVQRAQFAGDLEIRLPIGDHITLRAHAGSRLFQATTPPTPWPKAIDAALPPAEFGVKR